MLALPKPFNFDNVSIFWEVIFFLNMSPDHPPIRFSNFRTIKIKVREDAANVVASVALEAQYAFGI